MPCNSSIFEFLPAELQCSIIRYLDPVALISLSQTNTHFRRLINPDKTHFAERLLALECLPETGGPRIHFSRFGTAEPDRNTREWETNRWACTSCLRLLPHYAFNNYALSSLGYRKPSPDSPVPRRCTSWEATTRALRWGSLLEARRQQHDSKERQLRTRYALTTQNWGSRRHNDSHQYLVARLHHFWETGFSEFQGMSYSRFARMSEAEENAAFDREAAAVEFMRAGVKRHARRCIECRFRRGEFRGCAGNLAHGIGTPSVPIVVGRQQKFGTVVDRYFPGVSDVLCNKRPPFNAPVFVIHREDAHDRNWTLYRVRCPGCETWQELRAFRAGGVYPRWQPLDTMSPRRYEQYQNWDGTNITQEFLNGLRCNHCYVKEHGREKLGQYLVNWLKSLIDSQLGELAGNLRSGFTHLFWRLQFAPKATKADTKALLWDMRSLLGKHRLLVTRTDVALMKQRRAQWLGLYPRLKDGDDEGGLWFYPDRWFMDWVRHFDESEALWMWLKGCREEIQGEGKAELLVDWVLSRDETLHS